MRYWVILDELGEPVEGILQVASEEEPDATVYGGVDSVEITSIDPLCVGVWNGTDWSVDLTAMKQELIKKVNEAAENFRGLFITVGAGQALTYQKKEVEARDWTPGNNPNHYPFLKKEAQATSITIDELAATVIAQADAWEEMGSQIEALRRGAIVSIEQATTLEDANEAANVNWESLI